MQIYIGSDHAGYQLKEAIQNQVKEMGHNVLDLGTFNEESKVDYPDIAREVGEKVHENKESLGILICGSGIGVSIAANKLKGIRAANAYDLKSAELSRAHNNANILTLGQRLLDPELAKEIVKTFLTTPFEGGRHEGRVEKIAGLETDSD